MHLLFIYSVPGVGGWGGGCRRAARLSVSVRRGGRKAGQERIRMEQGQR